MNGLEGWAVYHYSVRYPTTAKTLAVSRADLANPRWKARESRRRISGSLFWSTRARPLVAVFLLLDDLLMCSLRSLHLRFLLQLASLPHHAAIPSKGCLASWGRAGLIARLSARSGRGRSS